jgi:hypothetical protein
VPACTCSAIAHQTYTSTSTCSPLSSAPPDVLRSPPPQDPAIQRIEPWSKPIPCPLLSINSEWFTHDDDYARLLALTRTVRGPKHVLGIAGTNHPSFADVFLITPSVAGGQTGLITSPYEVFLRTFEVVDVFLDTTSSDEEKERRLRGIGREVGEVSKPMGKPGEVFYQELVSSG